MSRISLFLSLTLALALPVVPCHATPPRVTVALSASGYEFTPILGLLITPQGKTYPPPQVINTEVTLQNHTGSGIPFTIDAGIKFEFALYNADGKQIWDSVPAVLPQFVMLATLPAGAEWHGTALVPLFLKDKPLAPGTYTVEASVFGSPGFSASTAVVIKQPIAVN